jgi:polyphosphate kinase 2 (PPK2 family)
MLDALDLSKKLKGREWQLLRGDLQRRLYDLQLAAFLRGMPAIVLLDGWAGSGQGEVIRVLTQRLDPRGFRAWAMRGPTEEEQNRPWLWRYWVRLPARGDLTIFDGSWYGQVVEDRVARRLRDDEARAALRDGLDLERMLADDGHAIVKLWLHIGPDEQRRRLRAPRGESLRWPGSRADDWEQHRKYQHYLPIVEEMLSQTDVEGFRWHLIEANNPFHAQWRVLQTVCAGLEAALQRQGEWQPPAEPAPPEVSVLEHPEVLP